jgi:hypothetical protein
MHYAHDYMITYKEVLMKIIAFVLLGMYGYAVAAAGPKEKKMIPVRIVNKLDATILVQGIVPDGDGNRDLQLEAGQGDDVVVPEDTTQLAFSYHSDFNADQELHWIIKGIRLRPIFERCELTLVLDKDAGFQLLCNEQPLKKIHIDQKLLTGNDVQPLLRRIASSDGIQRLRKAHAQYSSMGQLKH